MKTLKVLFIVIVFMIIATILPETATASMNKSFMCQSIKTSFSSGGIGSIMIYTTNETI